MTAIQTPDDGIAWITGASSGIGRQLALRLAQHGWTVAATARNADDLTRLAAEAEALPGSIIASPGDVTDAARMAEIVDGLEADHAPVALAILNAGIYLPVRDTPFDLGAFERSFAVNLNGTACSLAAVIDRMAERRNGHIVIVSSVAGYGGLPTSAAYGATKAGLTNMAESLKFDLDRRNIRISVVHPGFVKTPATDKNPFPMPFLMDVDDAVERLVAGLNKPGFEITFPKRFTYLLKAINLLPYRLYFPIVGAITGWSKRTD